MGTWNLERAAGEMEVRGTPITNHDPAGDAFCNGWAPKCDAMAPESLDGCQRSLEFRATMAPVPGMLAMCENLKNQAIVKVGFLAQLVSLRV